MSVALDRALEPSAPSLRADLEVRLRQAAEGIAIPLLALLLSAAIFSLFLLVQGYSPLQFFTPDVHRRLRLVVLAAELAAARDAAAADRPVRRDPGPARAWSSSAARVRWSWAA